MRFRISALIVIMLAIGLAAGCQQMPPTMPTTQTQGTGEWNYEEIPIGNAPRNVDLRVELNANGKAAGDSAGIVTLVSNLFRTPNGLGTVFQAREYVLGDTSRISSLNGRSYLVMPYLDGVPQIGTFSVNGMTLHDYVQIDENQGIFARVRIVPDDSLGFRLLQGDDNTDQFVKIHYVIEDPYPPDYTKVEFVGTQTDWNNRFSPMIYNPTFGIWEQWSDAIRGLAVKVAFFGDGMLINTKFIYADTPEMEDPVLLDCTELVTNPAAYFVNASWFTERNQLRNKRVFRIPLGDDGVLTQGCGGIPFTAKISVTNNTIPTTHVLKCATNLTNNGEAFILPRASGKWSTANLNMVTGRFWLSIWDETDGQQLVTKGVKIGTYPLVHLEETDGGSLAFTGAAFEGGVIVQGVDNLDIEIGH